ncbi:undecaprenyldiphospho-muramoylpentapeptide beta-N-acetylglucosaminyltransferase [Patescibacteria group bacterium]
MKIVITGGGTGGHVVPNLAVIDEIKKRYPDADLLYIGSGAEIEKKLIKDKIPYKQVPCGKLRRYFSFSNIIDLIKIPFGILKSLFILIRFRPKVIFGKGGYVSVPVVIAGFILRIPTVIHESDIHPGLANRILARFVKQVAVAFPNTKENFKKSFRHKVITIGNPIRKEILRGDLKNGQKFFNLNQEQAVIFITGGSQGAKSLNFKIAEIIESLVVDFQVIHQYGNSPIAFKHPNYHPYNFLGKEMADAYTVSDLVISRAGANTVFEIAALGKPCIFIPLSKKVSRGDQILNANFIKEKSNTPVLEEENLSPVLLERTIRGLLEDEDELKEISMKMKNIFPTDAAKKIVDLIEKCLT